MTNNNHLQILLTTLFFVFSPTLNCESSRHETLAPYGKLLPHLTGVTDLNYHPQALFNPLVGLRALLLTSLRTAFPFRRHLLAIPGLTNHPSGLTFTT